MEDKIEDAKKAVELAKRMSFSPAMLKEATDKLEALEWDQERLRGAQELPAHLAALSRRLVFLMRHYANDVGLYVRSDGFAKLDEILALDYMQKVVDEL